MFDAIALHAYWSSAGLTKWNALRYRNYPRDARPVLITECGRDRVRDAPGGGWLPPGDQDGYGWQRQGIDGDAFRRELSAFDRELLTDGNVYAALFTTSPDDGWRRKGFDCDVIADGADFTRIGPHDLMGASPQALRWAERAPVVKSVDNTAAIRRASRNAITVYRRRFALSEQTDILASQDAGHLVGRIVEGLAGFRHPNLYVELLNEVGKGQRADYVKLARVVAPQLRAIGLRVAGPSWATGDYESDDWQAFAYPEGTGMGNITLSAPMRSTHAADGNYEAGPRPRTIGVVVHSTRGGGRRETEYVSTINWFATPDAGVSAQLVVGLPPFDEVCRCVDDDQIAYHARALNQSHLGIELCQPSVTDEFTDFQYRAAGEAIRLWAAKYKIPIRRVMSQGEPGLIGHEDAAAGKADGKTDPGPKLDWDRLLAEALGGTHVTPPTQDATKLRDDCYAMANAIQQKGKLWRAAGYPQHAQLTEQAMEAYKTAIGPIGKGER